MFCPVGIASQWFLKFCLKVLLVVFKFLRNVSLHQLVPRLLHDNKKNVVSPYLDTLCSPLVKKGKDFLKKQ